MKESKWRLHLLFPAVVNLVSHNHKNMTIKHILQSTKKHCVQRVFLLHVFHVSLALEQLAQQNVIFCVWRK